MLSGVGAVDDVVIREEFIIFRTSPQRTNKIIPMLRIGNQQYINNINRQFSTEESVRYST